MVLQNSAQLIGVSYETVKQLELITLAICLQPGVGFCSYVRFGGLMFSRVQRDKDTPEMIGEALLNQHQLSVCVSSAPT